MLDSGGESSGSGIPGAREAWREVKFCWFNKCPIFICALLKKWY